MAEQDRKIKKLESMMPWALPGADWFTLFHPNSRTKTIPQRHFNLFVLDQDKAHQICSIGPDDYVFIARGQDKEVKP
jgi:hypothetical protein